MANPPPSSSAPVIARQARERFVAHIEGAMAPLAEELRGRLIELVDSASSTREMQERRDAMFEYDRVRQKWVEATLKAWRGALVPPTATARVRLGMGNLELIGDDVVENKILSSRLAMAVQEKAVWDLNELKQRILHIEGGEDLASEDILRAEAVAQLLVEQWTAAGLSRQLWLLVKDTLHGKLVARMVEGYRLANEFLVSQGILPDISVSTRVKRPASSPVRKAPAAPGAPDNADAAAQGPDTASGGGYGGPGGGGQANYGGQGSYGGQGQGPGGQGGQGGGNYPGGGGAGQGGYDGGHGGYGGGQGGQGGYGGAQGGGQGGGQGGYGAGQGGYAGGQGGQGGGQGGQGNYAGGGAGPGGSGYAGAQGGYPGGQGAAQGYAPAQGGGGGYAGGQGAEAQGQAGSGGMSGEGGGAHGPSGYAGATGIHDETRMLTGTTPLARARARASGVLGQLRRLLTDKVGTGFEGTRGEASPGLSEAIARHQTQVQTRTHEGTIADGEAVVYDNAQVQEVAVDLRRRTVELKKKAANTNEKATIEIVALMFQAILAEERIPPAVRVWFARLQMPVLRVALAEPEFFGSLEHPARQLIDRMGSCVLGFDGSTIGGSALELEIKRIVQVIEQYPETGRRVFQLVYDEFQKFLSRFLTEQESTQKLVSVAQQVEQKETLAIQYTIEMRKLLSDMPVREEIREFLFKVWAEVLALAAVRKGPQHAETVALKKAASDLVWAAGAKPNRAERAKVIQELPKLLVRLREGMTLLGVPQPQQEEHIKRIGDTLADAFLSKTEAIPHARIDELASQLANLENFISDEGTEELPLDKETIEMMLGIDATDIEVIGQGGSQPTAAMAAWARELQLGSWFSLDHNGRTSQVQYVWRSDRNQLHLFASTDGRSFLVQLKRLAAYLQAGLLLPTEEEALTVRATRDALAKLDANPERLFQ